MGSEMCIRDRSKTVQILVEISDPLSLKETNRNVPPLLLGSLVQVEFEGPERSGIIEVPRAGIREGRQIFAVDAEDRLMIRDATIVWKTRDAYYIRDEAKELTRVVLGKVQLAVEGAKLNAIKEGQPPEPPKEVDPSASEKNPRAKASATPDTPTQTAQ